MRRFRLSILVLGLCLGLGGLWAHAADPTGSNTSPPANTTTGTCTGTGCGTNTSGTTTGTCTGANCGTNTNVATGPTGPGDIAPGASVWYGLRAYTAAIATAGTQKLVNLRRASDNHTCDILVATSGGMGNTANCSTGGDNGQTASAFCNATTCSIPTAYDQSGNGNNVTQATAANQPTITFNCVGTKPCMVGSGTQSLTGSALVLAQPYSVSVVSERTTVTGAVQDAFGDAGAGASPQSGFGTAANTYSAFAGITANVSGYTESVAHVANTLFNGTSSIANLDGTSNSGLSTGTTSSSQPVLFGGNNLLTGDVMEAGLWAGDQSSHFTALCHNQFTYWGTTTSC